MEYSPVSTKRSWKVATERRAVTSGRRWFKPWKSVGPARPQRPGQQAPAHIGGQWIAPRPQEAVRPVVEMEARLRVGSRQAQQDLAGVKPHTGKRVTETVGGVQRDGQSIPYSFIFR